MSEQIQVIERNGKPEWAVLPYRVYLKLLGQAETLQDTLAYDRIKAAVERGEEETVSAEVAFALALGDNPVRVWREHAKLSQRQVAQACGISLPFLSQIETGKRNPSTKVVVSLAQALHVTVDDLIPITTLQKP
ncbi:MAG: helix-turn-helix transcriptional regulator, partial [Anaerolineaceae bacterium]|nr:helix-turn-helix transcriptional regulator [Anaerolineaceae bacterium]